MNLIFLEQIRISCNRIGKYHQLLAWGFVKLFGEQGLLNNINNDDLHGQNFIIHKIPLIGAKNDINIFNTGINEKDLKV